VAAASAQRTVITTRFAAIMGRSVSSDASSIRVRAAPKQDRRTVLARSRLEMVSETAFAAALLRRTN